MNNPAEQTRRLEEAGDWLVQLQEEGVSDEAIVSWVRWCESSAENRRAFERLLPLWQAFDTEQAHGALPEVALPLARRRRPRLVRTVWSLVATVLVVVAIALFVRVSGPGSQPMVLQAVATLQSAPGELRPARLPDGSRLDLGARSALSIDFAGTQRHVELQEGEAFFEVEPDRKRPFVVYAGDTRITAVGTAFNVLKSAGRVTVTVQEGAVEVSPAQQRSESLVASAGQQVTYDASRAPQPQLREVDPAAALAWRGGHLEYLSEPLLSIVSTLNRYTETQLVIADSLLGELRYTGTIEVHSIPEWVQALPRIFPVRIRHGERQLVIEAR